MAINEAERCLNCKNPVCVKGCPVNVKIPEFISLVAKGDFKAAYEKVSETNSLPAVCGRVCPQERQCEGNCVRGIKGESVAIGRLERFVADYYMKNHKNSAKTQVPNGKKVAVIGSGPAGLTCAGDLAKKGYDVTVFEALHLAGGVLVYGIPEFRLPKAIVQKEIDGLKALGVKIETNMVIGKVLSIDELMDEYGFESVFIGSGAGLPRFMNIPGENLKGVYSANEFLTRVNLMKAYKDDNTTPVKENKRVAVVGGGNVAMDAARCAKRLGAEEVYIVYRRGEDELPARAEEVEHAKEEGIIFKLLTNPVEILPDDNRFVGGIKCVEMELGEPDESGRRRPQVKENSEFVIDVDCVIMSIGTSPNPLIKSTTEGLETQKWGGIIADENGLTSRPGVFAGGDAVTGAATVILAMGAGKTAAKAMDEYLQNK
jgi:glutamate synthase (NADPH/NADH) small chain